MSPTPVRITHLAPTRSITVPATKRQPSDQKSQQKTLSELCAAESQRIGKRGIKNGKPVKNYADREKQIEKRRNDDPPAIEDSR